MAQSIPDPDPADFYSIRKQGRFYAVYEKGDQLIHEEGPQKDKLVCVCVYRKGAEEVRRRLVGKVPIASKKIAWNWEGDAEVAADSPLDDDTDDGDSAGAKTT